MGDKELLALMAATIFAGDFPARTEDPEKAAIDAVSAARRILAKSERASELIRQQRGL